MYSLFLYQKSSPEIEFDEAQLVDLLNQLQLTQTSELGLQAGESLMELITFLGCSPSITNDYYTANILIHLKTETFALGGEAIDKIRYPGCGCIIAEPAQLLKVYPQQPLWQCDKCQSSGALSDINWRRSAGFSRCFIEISNIFPKEALPSDALLQQLSDFSGQSWDYFYSRSTQN